MNSWGDRPIIIKFKVSKHRKKKGNTPVPVIRSKYAQALFDKGAGWKND